MTTPDLETYFAALHSRQNEARIMKHRVVSAPGWTPKPNCCHPNIAYCVELNPQLKPVHGWMIRARGWGDSCNYVAHSVFEEGGELYDITLAGQAECDLYPFIRHVGTEAEFCAVKQVRCELWYPPCAPDLSDADDEPDDVKDTGYG